MKKPDLKDLAKPASKPKALKPKKTEAVRKTFSFSQSHLDQINAVAVKLSKTEGRPVNASEALRSIIDQYTVKQ